MIKTEIYKVLPSGKTLTRTYSTLCRMIERDGVQYSEAIDDASFAYEYTETEIPCESATATEEDYLTALGRLGVTDD